MNMYKSPLKKLWREWVQTFDATIFIYYWDCLGGPEILMIGPLTSHKKRYACHPKCSQKSLHQKFVPILLVISGVGNPKVYKPQFTVCNLA